MAMVVMKMSGLVLFLRDINRIVLVRSMNRRINVNVYANMFMNMEVGAKIFVR